jgi:hypothetical protein
VIDDPSLIFIDEFQNYSPFEIQCLKSAYESPVFNLFGDYDQRIEEKGLDLKSKLISLLSPNSYNINVNYRNAKPITEYINRQVHKNMQSIGLNGTVIETQIDQCEFKISDRTAIICKDPKLALIFLKRYIDSSRINNSITTKELLRDKFTLMTVLDCKGLEFDTVYVFDYGMTENEKYVAYTRALDTLVVISDNLEEIKKAEEEAERRKREEQRLRKKEEQERKKKQVLYEKILSVLQQVHSLKVSESELLSSIQSTDKGDNNSEVPMLNDSHTNTAKIDVECKADPPVEQKPSTTSDHSKTQQQRLEDELKKLQEYRADLERKEEESHKAELLKKEKLYSLAMSKIDSNDILQLTEAVVLFETLIDYKNAIEMIACLRVKISQITAQEQSQKEAYRRQNLCQYCGGKFKGLFNKQCRNCGKKKDY